MSLRAAFLNRLVFRLPVWRGRFDSLMFQGVTVTSCQKDRLEAIIESPNAYNSGYQLAVMDEVQAFLSHFHSSRILKPLSVSTNMSLNRCDGCPAGQSTNDSGRKKKDTVPRLRMVSRITGEHKTMVVMSMELYDDSSGLLISSGSHTKFYKYR